MEKNQKNRMSKRKIIYICVFIQIKEKKLLKKENQNINNIFKNIKA